MVISAPEVNGQSANIFLRMRQPWGPLAGIFILLLELGRSHAVRNIFKYGRSPHDVANAIISSTTNPLRFSQSKVCLTSGSRSQSRSKSRFNLLVSMANLLFPNELPGEYKQTFAELGCKRYSYPGTLAPEEEWLQTTGWAFNPTDQLISFSGQSEAKEPPHAFPFNLFLPRRPSLRTALIKQNFLCANSQIQAAVMLESAEEAGVLFRVIGERNFWGVFLVPGDDGIKLIRVKNGERIELGSVGKTPVKSETTLGPIH